MSYGDVVWLLVAACAYAIGYVSRDVVRVWRTGRDTDELIAHLEERNAQAKNEAWEWRQKAESLAEQVISAVDAGPSTKSDGPYDQALPGAEAGGSGEDRARVYRLVSQERSRKFEEE